VDRDYPVWLRDVYQAPPVIFTLGTVIADDAAVSVVGSREASPAGLAMAADIARALTARKLTVISGLARGIDTAVSSGRSRVAGSVRGDQRSRGRKAMRLPVRERLGPGVVPG
jgi:predicted Rossmann fold nucleotide-binding protein DprA/Smf involved in DNA uptake